jgi:hypothetical protein
MEGTLSWMKLLSLLMTKRMKILSETKTKKAMSGYSCPSFSPSSPSFPSSLPSSSAPPVVSVAAVAGVANVEHMPDSEVLDLDPVWCYYARRKVCET